MAEVKWGKEDPEWLFFKEFFVFAQKYGKPEDNDKYWEDLVVDAGTLGNRFPSVQFAPITIADYCGYLTKLASSQGIKPRYEVSWKRIA